MVHSLLSGLPELLDGHEEEANTSITPNEQTETAAEHSPLEGVDISPNATTSTTLPLESIISAPASVFGEIADAAPIVESETTPSVATTETISSDATPTDPSISPSEPSTPPSEDGMFEQQPKCEPSLPSSRSSTPEQADDLYMNFPPTDPSLGLATIMGPNSVIFTWSEDPCKLPLDDDAEGMPAHTELVVHPHVDLPSDEEEAVNDEKTRRRRRKGPSGGKKRSPRMERRAMIAGAVLVLGVSIMVYGIRAGHTRGHGAGRAWQKLGSSVVSAADQLTDAFRLWY